MYKIPRLMLQATVILYGYMGLLGIVAVSKRFGLWPIIIAFAFMVGRLLRKKANALTAMGTARWATRDDLERAGMYRDKGLILGRLPEPKRRIRFKVLFNRRKNARDACKEYLNV